jgi:hypothetical protein
MTFSRGKPTGFVTGDRLTAAQINTIDLNQSRAIDGYEGGDYTPASSLRFMSQVKIGSTGYLGVESGGEFELAAGATMVLGDITDTSCATYNGRTFLTPAKVGQTSGNIIPDYGSTYSCWTQSTATSGALLLPLDSVPRIATVTNIAVRLKGAGGHAALPSTPPSIEFMSHDYLDGGLTQLAIQVDTSATPGAYETAHYISTPAVSVSMNQLLGFVVRLKGESGDNALADLQFFSVIVYWTCSRLGHN